MRVVCRHGHFAFYPQADDEVFRFVKLFGTPIYPERDYFTFASLVGLPRWSITARLFGTLPATVTFEGVEAWEVMEANALVYSLATGLLVPLATIAASVSLPMVGDKLRAPTPLVQPGTFLSTGERLMGYDGILDLATRRLYIYSTKGLA